MITVQTKDSILSRTKIGDWFPHFGTSLPPTYLFCDGSSLSTTGTYAELFSALQYRFGGSGGSFNLPDTRGCIVAGMGKATDPSGTDFTTFGELVNPSAQSVSLTTIPYHAHAQGGSHYHGSDLGNGNGYFYNSHSHEAYYTHCADLQGTYNQSSAIQSFHAALSMLSSGSNGTTGTESYNTCAVDGAATGVTVNGVSGRPAGGASPHDNMMAWMAVPFIIKYTY